MTNNSWWYRVSMRCGCVWMSCACMAMDKRLRVCDWPDIVEPRVSCSARAFSLTPSTHTSLTSSTSPHRWDAAPPRTPARTQLKHFRDFGPSIGLLHQPSDFRALQSMSVVSADLSRRQGRRRSARRVHATSQSQSQSQSPYRILPTPTRPRCELEDHPWRARSR